MKKIFTLMALTLIVNVQIFAVTAYPHPVVFAQPNGDELTVMIKGDERIHWHESLDGYTLLYNTEGYLTYAVLDEESNLQPSAIIATNIEKRSPADNAFLSSLGKKLFYSEEQKQFMLKIWEIEDDVATRGDEEIEGQFKTLCAFVQFPEKSFIKTMSQFEDLMNQLGYTVNGTGSVRDFFKEASYNKFDLIVTLCGIYTAPNSESYYAGSDGTQNCQSLARWAALQVAAEPDINFADYDSNNDGKVDGFHFIFAGVGQETGACNTCIWSHKWQFSPAVTKNGKSISVYSCSPELYSGTTLTTIGVICHEMSHAFGAPDFYDTNGATGGSYTGTGNWDLMAGGSWNGSPGGNCPPHHNMYTKVQFGWVTPIVLSTPTTVTNMPNSAENPVAYRINTGNGTEHYLLDNRQKVKFDVTVPGPGLLIYHVHGSVGTSGINATHPQKMYPVCASSTVAIPVSGSSNYGSINSAGCPFPGSSGKTAFDGTTTPRMFYWTNTVIHNKQVTNITNIGGLVSFDFMGGGTPQYTVSLSSNPSNGGTTTGAGSYYENSSVTVTATPNTNFSFYNWTKSGNVVSTNTSYTFNISENTTLVANFRSSNANLSNLTVNPGTLTPAFSPTTTNYTVNVPYAVSSITITGTAAETSATVVGNGTKPLNVGSNTFTITVTAQDGTTKNYTVNVTRAAPSANANLSNLTVSAGILTPDFNTAITNYIVEVGFTIETINITGIAEDTNATVTGNGDKTLNVGNNNFTITVTAENGSTTKQYMVNVIRAAYASNNANLESLTVSEGTLTPVFDPAVTDYTVEVAYPVSTVTITCIPEDSNATVSGDGAKSLNVGDNVFTIIVTAEDGTTIKQYSLNIIRTAPSTNANLENLTVNPGVLQPEFNPAITDYSVDVDYKVTTITITCTAADLNATVSGDGIKTLSFGENNFTIIVTAEDGTTTKQYTVKVTRSTPPQYTIVSSVEDNIGGTISPEGTTMVEESDDITFTMTPEENYTIEYILVDGENVGTVETYTFNNIDKNHTIVVKFQYHTSIAEGNISEITIYPNPTTGDIRFEISDIGYEILEIAIFDVFGRKAPLSPPKGGKRSFPFGEGWDGDFDISHLPTGTYFIRITTENGVVTKKIIKT